jgi:Pectate lyase superfamily protein
MEETELTNVAISALPAATTPLTGKELGVIVQSGVTSNASSASMAAAGTYVDCRDFTGLDPTGSTDSSGAINAAIQKAITVRLPVYLPAGSYKISSPLLFVVNVPGDYTEFTNITFFGAGIGSYGSIGSSSPGQALTAIYPSFNNLPAIALGPSLQTYIHDLAIFGLNVAPEQYVTGGTPGYPVDNQTDYITSGCRLDQYSPYCAIAIDTLNQANAGHEYPGMTYYTGAGGSNFCTFENLYIQGFVVGIAYGISGVNQNSDDLTFKNVQIWYCDSGYACGNTPSR